MFVYPLPWDLQFSAIYQNFAGVPITATWAVNNAIVGPSLGRNIAACGANCAPTSSFGNLESISPGTVYEDRQQQVDLRFARLFRFGRANLRPSLDLCPWGLAPYLFLGGRGAVFKLLLYFSGLLLGGGGRGGPPRHFQ
jgi:hypothetical protein